MRDFRETQITDIERNAHIKILI